MRALIMQGWDSSHYYGRNRVWKDPPDSLSVSDTMCREEYPNNDNNEGNCQTYSL